MKSMRFSLWNHKRVGFHKASDATNFRRSVAMERLEDRRLAAVDIYFDDGIRGGGPDHPELRGVHIVGTDRADRIEITHQGGQLKVWAARPTGTGLVSVFNADDVPRIFFDGLKGNDSFTSNSSIETIVRAGDGDDTITGGWGQVLYFGDAGNDFIEPGNLAYGSMHGGKGNDEIRAGEIGMNLYGGDDDDYLYGGSGDDIIVGGDGNDQLFGGADQDTLEGGAGHDQLQGGSGDDVLSGQDGIDVLHGDGGLDWIDGGADRDLLDGGDDALVDRVIGGSGPDFFVVEWRFYDGGIHYFEDDVFDFLPQEGDRYLYYDFKERLFTEWSGMNYSDFLASGGGSAGFTALDDWLSANDVLAMSHGLEVGAIEPTDVDSLLSEQSVGDSFDLEGMDQEISILEGVDTFDEVIEMEAVLDAPIVDLPGILDEAIIDTSLTDYFFTPTIAPLSVIPVTSTRSTLRWF